MMLGLVLTALTAAPLIKDGDTVVFFGDSITVQHAYMRNVEVYLALRFPQWKVTFINAGVGGNTAADGLKRLETDVLVHHPDVVLVNFGMNDASYPPGSDGADFEKNMAAIFDRLKKERVRQVVWLDTSPFDVEGLGPKNFNRARQTRIDELVAHAHAQGAERKLPVVDWEKPLLDALAAFRNAGRSERLLPDRIHPGPLMHAVMAASLLRGLGFDVSAPSAHAVFKDGAVKVDGFKDPVPWDGASDLAIDLRGVPAPVPLVMSARDAKDLGDADVQALRKLMLRIDGLPGDKYTLKFGEYETRRFSRAELSHGIDLMALTQPRPPQDDDRSSLTACAARAGNPFVNDWYCLWDLTFEKDQLRIAMRHEKMKGLPDFAGDYLERYSSMQQVWVKAVDDEIDARAKALREAPHVVTLAPVAAQEAPARDGGARAAPVGAPGAVGSRAQSLVTPDRGVGDGGPRPPSLVAREREVRDGGMGPAPVAAQKPDGRDGGLH